MMNDSFLKTFGDDNEFSFDIKREISYYMFFWPWFLLAVLLFTVTSFFYLRYTEPIYLSSAQLLIKDANSDPSDFLVTGLDGPFDWNRINLSNDIATISSQHILTKVVEELNLQTRIYGLGAIVGSINTTLLYNGEVPISINFKNKNLNQSWDLAVNKNKLTITNEQVSYEVNKGEKLDTDEFYIEPYDSLFLTNREFKVSNILFNDAVQGLRDNLNVSAPSKRGEYVDIAYKGPNVKLNESVLNTLIKVLEEDQIYDKRKVFEVSIDFINDRLEKLTKTLDTITDKTLNFQIKNELYFPETQTGIALNKIAEGQDELLNFEIQKEITNMLLSKLNNQEKYSVLPSNIGLENESVNSLINQYNEIINSRNKLLISATAQNPLVLEFDKELDRYNSAIKLGLNRHIDAINLSIKNFSKIDTKTKDLVSKFPKNQIILNEYARSFNFVEGLYILLLQRKEEASISSISALPSLKVLSYGVTSSSPSSPQKTFIYAVALLAGIIIPFSIIYIMKLLDTKINTREDLEEGLKGISIIGEVPFDENFNKNEKRGIIKESIRVIRSNIGFMINDDESKVITVSSTVKGEGKSFVSFNIAESYRDLGKKVLLIGADLRNPQIHSIMGVKRPSSGLTSYLTDHKTDISDIIKIDDTYVNNPLHVIFSGAIPPNPAELLLNSKMNNLIYELKKKYDYIIIDSAPLMLVSDTSALLPLSDLLVYVSRAQFSDKNIFPFIKDLYNKEQVPAIGNILNGLIVGPKSGYKYRYNYAYRYSYSYKYNYGYGYGYGENKE